VYRTSSIALIIVILVLVAAFIFAPISKGSETSYLYIHKQSTMDSIAADLHEQCHPFGAAAVLAVARHWDYPSNIHTGRYAITPTTGAFLLVRHMKNGLQEPMRLTIPTTRTKDDLARELSKKLMMKATEVKDFLNNPDSCASFGKNPETIICLFIPNTYEVYWDISVRKLLTRMNTEQHIFWNGNRRAKAQALGLTTDEVITLASIVDEETTNTAEKPMVAGMYYNRLKTHMPLQADPTIKFALNQFDIKRIYNNMLSIDSPYNTYVNEGLPPGPIRIPTIAGIDAVLNLVHHNYLYMCAKEDFSGTHNFAVTYEEHLDNAKRYSTALNARGIK
jgi:UPF0755 protein